MVAFVAMVALAGPAHAEMKDWQLRRFLNFRSECPDRIDEWTCHILTKPLEFKDISVPDRDDGR